MAVSSLAQALGDLDEATAIDEVVARLGAGDAPFAILEELQAGTNSVGGRSEAGEYYVGADVSCGPAQEGPAAAKRILGVR
jgi:methanogenic corrinoid protein MtbC1